MTPTEAEELLTGGQIEVISKVPGSSNQALLVEVREGEATTLACYKCERGERRLWDFPPGLWRREVAAYELDRALATELVPPTVARLDGPYGPGSLQWWVEDNGDDHYFTLRDKRRFTPYLMRLCAFDFIANNADRKSGHVIYDGARCWAIDNGLSFHEDDKLRTVIWDYAGTPVTEQLRERIAMFADGETGDVGTWISPDELESAKERARRLASAGVLPDPDNDGDWPPVPWPLV